MDFDKKTNKNESMRVYFEEFKRNHALKHTRMIGSCKRSRDLVDHSVGPFKLIKIESDPELVILDIDILETSGQARFIPEEETVIADIQSQEFLNLEDCDLNPTYFALFSREPPTNDNVIDYFFDDDLDHIPSAQPNNAKPSAQQSENLSETADFDLTNAYGDE